MKYEKEEDRKKIFSSQIGKRLVLCESEEGNKNKKIRIRIRKRIVKGLRERASREKKG